MKVRTAARVERALVRSALTRNSFCPTGPGGGVDPTCSPGKQEHRYELKVGALAAATKFVGRPVTREQLAAVAGALPGSAVTIDQEYKTNLDGSFRTVAILVHVEHPKYSCSRKLYKNSADELCMENSSFYAVQTGTRVGTEVFAQQVKEASDLGVKYVRTHAAGSGKGLGLGHENGYYTWPRLGYDTKLNPSNSNAEEHAVEKLGATYLSDLMKTPEGRKYWKENGVPLTLRFDLAPNSLSRRVLDEYVRSKRADGATTNSHPGGRAAARPGVGAAGVRPAHVRDNRPRVATDPTRIDPTRTALLRRAFASKLSARFDALARVVAAWVTGPRFATFNAFCPTGKGGGVDPTCSPASLQAEGWAPSEVQERWLREGKVRVVHVDIDRLVPREGEPLEGVEEAAPRKIASIKRDWEDGARHYLPEGFEDEQGRIHLRDGRHRVVAQRSRGRKTVPVIVTNTFCPTGPGGGVDPTCSPGDTKKNFEEARAALDRHDAYRPKLTDDVDYEEWEKADADHKLTRTKLISGYERAANEVYRHEAIEKMKGDTVPLRGEFASWTTTRGEGPYYVSKIGRAVDSADRGLTGTAKEAMDQFVGHSHESLDRGGMAGGIMSEGKLESILRTPSSDVGAKNQIASAFSPVRDSLREKYGDTLPLYRFQSKAPDEGFKSKRVVLSYTSDPKFAAWHGQGLAGEVVPVAVPLAQVAWVTNRANQKEFIVYVDPQPTTNALADFSSDVDLLEQFEEWLKGLLASTLQSLSEEQLWRLYVEDGFRKGAGRAFDDVAVKSRADLYSGGVKLPGYDGTREQFLSTSFGQPVSVDKVKLLARRAFSELLNVTTDTATRVRRTLADGLVQGKGPREVARDLVKAVAFGKTRALTVARTELIRAHAEGQLTALKNLGVEEIGVMVEWSVSGLGTTRKGNPSPCPVCAPLKGVVLKIDEASGMLPRHPNCMCSFIPANVGEDQSKQKRSAAQVTAAVAASRAAGAPKGTKAGKIRKGKGRLTVTGWAKKLSITQKRPVSVLNAFCPTGKGGGVDPTCGKNKTVQPLTSLDRLKQAGAPVGKHVSPGLEFTPLFDPLDKTFLKAALPRKRDVTLGDRKQKKSEAAVGVSPALSPRQQDRANGFVRELFGTKDDAEGRKALAHVLGMPDDAKVTITEVGLYRKKFNDDTNLMGVGVRVSVQHPKLGRVSRFVGVDHEKKRFIRNEIVEIKSEFQKSGLGQEIFAKQVEAASEHGFDYISTHAAGSGSTAVYGGMNGYYTWPRFGYDQKIDARNAAGKLIRSKFPSAKTVQDVYRAEKVYLTPDELAKTNETLAEIDAKLGRPYKYRTSVTGREWWQANGIDLYRMKFDLEPGSTSMRLLTEYQKSRNARKSG